MGVHRQCQHGDLSLLCNWRFTPWSATLTFAFLPISLLFVGVECTAFGMPHHPQGIFPPSPAMLCQGIKPVKLQHITYSGTAPKSGTARASAAKILQYSRLEFWTLHSWKYKQKSQEPVPSYTNASLGPLPIVSLP